MKLIIYYHEDAFLLGETLKTVIDQNFQKCDCQTFQTFNALKERLKKIADFNDKEIFILLADSQTRLTQLTSLIDLMEGKCLILVLPDESKPTLSQASLFYPRFFTKISSNYDDLCKVLSKMIGHQTRRKYPEKK